MFELSIQEKRERIRKQLTGIGNLPSVPHLISQVSELLNDEKTSANDLCKVISQDQAMVTKILTVANSPLYGLPRRVSTVEFAVVIIGFDHLKNIVLAISLVDSFKLRTNQEWDHSAYWKHSLLTATAAKRIADDLHYPRSGEAFTAGILHDLGMVILYRFLNYDFKKITGLVDRDEMKFHEAEKRVLGYGHAEIAEFLLEKWNFPPTIIDAVVHHHQPSQSEKNPILSSLVHLVDYMTHKFSLGTFKWDDKYELDEKVIDILGFGSRENIERFMDMYEPLFKNHLETINII